MCILARSFGPALYHILTEPAECLAGFLRDGADPTGGATGNGQSIRVSQLRRQLEIKTDD